jgi:hypothetical protein
MQLAFVVGLLFEAEERPNELASQDGTQHVLVVFQREKK